MSHTCICLRSRSWYSFTVMGWRDGRLSRAWCEVAPAEIRARNLPTANPALYHTFTSAPSARSGIVKCFENSCNGGAISCFSVVILCLGVGCRTRESSLLIFHLLLLYGNAVRRLSCVDARQLCHRYNYRYRLTGFQVYRLRGLDWTPVVCVWRCRRL